MVCLRRRTDVIKKYGDWVGRWVGGCVFAIKWEGKDEKVQKWA